MSHILNKNNHAIISAINDIAEQELKEIAKSVVLNEMTSAKLIAEFGNTISKRVIRKTVTGDNLRCFFAVTLGGAGRLWKVIADKLSIPAMPMSDDVYERVEELIDDIPFDEIFNKEIHFLNEGRLPFVS